MPFEKRFLRKCGSAWKKLLQRCPDGKDPNNWAAFVRNENTAEVRARNAKNAENAKKDIYRHTNGRGTYAHKLDKMDKEDPSRKHGRVDSWKKGHERHDGTILASAQTHYEQVDASNKRRKEASAGGEGSVMEVDFDNDELSKVFGPDKGSRTRGISSNKSKKQLQRTGIAKALLQQASSSSNSELKGEMNEMKFSLSNVIGVLKDVLKAVKNNETSTTQQPCGLTPETEVGSSSVRHSTQQNLMNMFANLNPPSGTFGSSPNVSLLDRDGVVVAKGYVMTETAGDCNGRKVLASEKKVYIEEVLVGDALVY
ncbi:hypothetical protein IFM89_005818, partial [Coptis chinensis]